MKRLLQLFLLLAVFGLVMFLLCFVRVEQGIAPTPNTDAGLSLTVGEVQFSIAPGVITGLRRGFSAIGEFSACLPCYLTEPLRGVMETAVAVFSHLCEVGTEQSGAVPVISSFFSRLRA